MSHENHYFLENKKVLQRKNPLKTISGISLFYVFRSNNTLTIPHLKTLKNVNKLFLFSINAFGRSLNHVRAGSVQAGITSGSRLVLLAITVLQELAEAASQFA